MKTSEKSVEEIVEDFRAWYEKRNKVTTHYHIMEYIEDLLQAERQRCEEIRKEALEEALEIAQEEERYAVGMLKLVPQTIVRRLQALTQPNNK